MPINISSASEQAEYDFLFDIDVFGEAGVGKSTLIRSAVAFYSDDLDDNAEARSRNRTKVNYSGQTVLLRLQAYNSPPPPPVTGDFGNYVRNPYPRRTHCTLVCFDVTNRATFEKVTQIIQTIRDDYIRPIILVGTKCDLSDQRQVDTEEALEAVSGLGTVAYVETDALNSTNIPHLLQNAIVANFQRIKHGIPLDPIEDAIFPTAQYVKAAQKKHFFTPPPEAADASAAPQEPSKGKSAATIASTEVDAILRHVDRLLEYMEGLETHSKEEATSSGSESEDELNGAAALALIDVLTGREEYLDSQYLERLQNGALGELVKVLGIKPDQLISRGSGISPP